MPYQCVPTQTSKYCSILIKFIALTWRTTRNLTLLGWSHDVLHRSFPKLDSIYTVIFPFAEMPRCSWRSLVTLNNCSCVRLFHAFLNIFWDVKVAVLHGRSFNIYSSAIGVVCNSYWNYTVVPIYKKLRNEEDFCSWPYQDPILSALAMVSQFGEIFWKYCPKGSYIG